VGKPYDVIVVGARCAGAPTAMLLARQGHRVLLIDKFRFPSDMPLSTHLIHPSGCARLAAWGLLEAVLATGSPPIERYVMRLGDHLLAGAPPPVGGVRAATCPRRILLDQILIEAAVAEGVELREGCLLRDLVRDGDRVHGVRVRGEGGDEFTEAATLVIGADGTRSTVARCAGAEAYNEMPRLQGTYWGYWADVGRDAAEFVHRDGVNFYVLPTNHELAVVGVNLRPEVFQSWGRDDLDHRFLEACEEAAPALAERLRGGRRAERWLAASTPTFFRRPHGAGWALVGDAGYKKDPITGQGISDAFQDAEELAAAVHLGLAGGGDLDAVLSDLAARRDESALDSFDFTRLFARLELAGEYRALAAGIAASPAHTEAFLGVLAGSVSLSAFASPEAVERLLRAGLGGSPPPAAAPGAPYRFEEPLS